MIRTIAGVLWGLSLIPLGAATGQGGIAGGDLPPPGFGSLNQDQISIRLTAGDLEIRFLPLDERALRLVAPDGYESLHGLTVSRQAQLDSAAQAAGVAVSGLALVSFFALRGDARFDPENLNLVYRNQLFRPAAIVPVTASFSGRQLRVREQAAAIYIFAVAIPVFEHFELSYGGLQSSSWDDVLQRIERERIRVLSRAQADKPDSANPRPQ